MYLYEIISQSVLTEIRYSVEKDRYKKIIKINYCTFVPLDNG